MIALGVLAGVAVAQLARFVRDGGRVRVSVDDRPLSRALAVAAIVILVIVVSRLVIHDAQTRDCLHDTRNLVAHLLAQDRAATPAEAAQLRETC